MAILLVLVIGLGLVIVGFSHHTSADNPRQALINHYHLGSCYGMSGPTIGPSGTESGPIVKLTRIQGGWSYKISNGQCCDITDYTGTISDTYKIKQQSKHAYTVPC